MDPTKTSKVKQLGDWVKKHPKTSVVIAGTILMVWLTRNSQLENTSVAPLVVSQSVAENPLATTSTQTSSALVKTEAQKELNDVINLAKKANLVTSYEFSDSASVVYIDSVWYTQTVQFKKDFLAKIGTLKKTITGFSHFEIRDAYSNEKVAEITSFSSSLEVYK